MGLSPVSLVTGDTAALSEWPWQGTQLLVMVVFGLSSSFQRKYNGCDQIRLLWASLSCVVKIRDVGWKEGAQPAVKDKVGQAGLEDEGKDLSPPVAVALQCIPKVFCKKLLSVQLSSTWLEVCWKPPSLHHPCSALLGAAKLLQKPKFAAALKWEANPFEGTI